MALRLPAAPVEPQKPMTFRLPVKPAVSVPLKTQGGNVVKGALEAPLQENVFLAKDMKGDELYANVHPMPKGRPYKMFRMIGLTEDRKQMIVTFYADDQKQWMTIEVPLDHLFTTEEIYLKECGPEEKVKKTKAPKDPKAPKAVKVAKPKAEKSVKAPAKTNGKDCTYGMIGEKKVLIDAGDGKVLGRYNPKTFNASEEAAKLKRNLVKQSEASPEAMKALRKAWAEAKAK